MALNSSPALRAATLLTRACSLARASSALRASTAAAPSAVRTNYINTCHLNFSMQWETGHIPCDVSSRSFIRVISASIDPICLDSSATSTDGPAAGPIGTCTRLQNYHWFMIPRLPPRAGNQSLRGCYLYGAHLACALQPKKYRVFHYIPQSL